jgi:hypothetical protein
VAKRTPETNRRKLIEDQRRKAKAAERRKTVLTIVGTTLVGALIVGAAVYFSIKTKKDRENNAALRSVGVAAESAACDAPVEDKIPDSATDAAKHTAKDGDHVDYDQSPPTSGRHNPTPLPVGANKFYSRDAGPPPERAVHNLEHAYTVVWYDKKATDAQIAVLKEAADSAEGKFLVVPWDRTDFAGDKHIVLTAWGEHQACGDVSGAVIQEFMDKFGGNNGRAPEKGAI